MPTYVQPAQQYQNSLSIATGIQELARIWRKRERKRHPIVTVQEHVRRVTEALKSCQDPCNLRARDEKMLTTTLDQIQTIFRNELEQNPDSLNAWHSTRNAFQLGPPEINSRYYLYGLLDCTAQLGCAVNIRSVRLDLYVMLEKFVFKTRVKEFRWKAVSFGFQFFVSSNIESILSNVVVYIRQVVACSKDCCFTLYTILQEDKSDQF